MPLLQFKTLTMTDLTIYKNDYCISTDKTKLDLKTVHAFLSTKAYWCLNIPYETVKKAAENSLNFGVISKWLMETIMNHSELQGLRRWILLTGDAHGLYRQFGWTDIADAAKWMELHNKNVYSK
jgi:hypothetical protein